MNMKLSFRWYGESDPISLQYISQIPGMRSIVSAVYDVKPGEVWPEESLAAMEAQCKENGLIFDVVESIPVHEDIKLGRGDVDHLLEVYCENIRRCAKHGVKCVTYNFMPVFDWTRTQLDKEAKDGSTSLVMYWDQMRDLDPLKDDIHLPGWDSSYTQDEVRELITAYGQLGEEGLSRLRDSDPRLLDQDEVPLLEGVYDPAHAALSHADLLGQPLAAHAPAVGQNVQRPVDVRVVEAEHWPELRLVDNLHSFTQLDDNAIHHA